MRIHGSIYCVTIMASLAISTRGAAGEGGGYQSDQGTAIFGMKDPLLEGRVLPYKQGNNTELRIELGVLKRTVEGVEQSIKGMTFNVVDLESVSVTLEIEEVQQHKNIYSATISGEEYKVFVTGRKRLEPLCADDNWALVVPGSWSGSQFSSQPANGFTFTCVPYQPAPPAQASADSAPGSATQSALARPSAALAPVARDGSARLPDPAVSNWPLSLDVRIARPPSGGAAAKCIDYGYAPWPTGDKTPPQSVTEAGSFFNLCVHAMTADYMGDGVSHTISGTQLRLFQLSNLATATCALRSKTLIECTDPPMARHHRQNSLRAPPAQPSARPSAQHISLGEAFTKATAVDIPVPQVGDLLLESVWREDDKGIARMHCLSRARWLTIDAMDTSFQSQDGPQAESKEGLKPCDTLIQESIDDLGRDRPLIVAYSAVNERGLWRFSNGTSWITTSRVRWDDQAGPQPSNGLPPCVAPCVRVFEGLVLPAPWQGNKTVPIYLYKKRGANSYATATVSAAQKLEGYRRVHFSNIEDGELKVQYRPTRNPGAMSLPKRPGVSSVMRAPAPSDPEGYLFLDSPELPQVFRILETGPQARRLEMWTQGANYCTTTLPAECPNSRGKEGLGFLLFPSMDATLPLPRLPLLMTNELWPHLDLGRPPPDSIQNPPGNR